MTIDALHQAVSSIAGDRKWGVAICSLGRLYRVRINVGGAVVVHEEARDLDRAVCAALATLHASQGDDNLEFMLRRSIQLAKEKKVAR